MDDGAGALEPADGLAVRLGPEPADPPPVDRVSAGEGCSVSSADGGASGDGDTGGFRGDVPADPAVDMSGDGEGLGDGEAVGEAVGEESAVVSVKTPAALDAGTPADRTSTAPSAAALVPRRRPPWKPVRVRKDLDF